MAITAFVVTTEAEAVNYAGDVGLILRLWNSDTQQPTGLYCVVGNDLARGSAQTIRVPDRSVFEGERDRLLQQAKTTLAAFGKLSRRDCAMGDIWVPGSVIATYGG